MRRLLEVFSHRELQDLVVATKAERHAPGFFCHAFGVIALDVVLSIRTDSLLS